LASNGSSLCRFPQQSQAQFEDIMTTNAVFMAVWQRVSRSARAARLFARFSGCGGSFGGSDRTQLIAIRSNG
jgi:hypothetical protein